MKKILLVAASLGIVFSAAAQPGNQKKAYPEKPSFKHQKENLSAEEFARERVDMMSEELSLTGKQKGKLNDFFVKDFNYRKENFKRPEGPRPDFKGERSGEAKKEFKGEHREGHGHHHPQMSKEDMKKMEKYSAKQEKKLKKIIGDDNYSKWRSSHPINKRPHPQKNG